MNTTTNKKIGLTILVSLIFSLILPSCNGDDSKDNAITIQWESGKAKGLFIPVELVKGLPPDSIARQLRVYLRKANNDLPVLGDYSMDNYKITFTPVVPLTEGMKYELRLRDKVIAVVDVPATAQSNPPELLRIYPVDTIPSNLLKIHLQFSKPMQEGNVMDFISFTKKNGESVPSVFLDLQTELWDSSRTLLTLWLDPGRIKRDLQPNKSLGPPIEEGQVYTLRIRDAWRDTKGMNLTSSYETEYTVGLRDSISPDIERWTFHLPKAGTSDSMKIDFHESLDYVLLKKCIRILDSGGNVLPGDISITLKEKGLVFAPAAAWKSGEYVLECEARLEDLAGNNLNRLFDQDLTNKDKARDKAVYKRSFRLQ